MSRSLVIFFHLIVSIFVGANSRAIAADGILDVAPCTLDAIIEDQCGILIPDAYIYDNQYGPRSITITTPYDSTDNGTSITPEMGWHEGNTKITWSSTTLLPGNIKLGKKIFGVTGTLDNTVYGNCTYYQSTSDLTSPNTNTCYVPSGSYYIYSSYWGGRKNLCSFTQIDSSTYQISNKAEPTKSKGACWINTSDPPSLGDGFNINNSVLKTNGVPNFIIRNTSSNIVCPRSGLSIGLQATSCVTPDIVADFAGYFYPANITKSINNVNQPVSGAFGGRSKNCIYGSNNQPCWVVNSTDFVENNTFCTEKIPDGSVDANGNAISSLGTPLNLYSCKTSDVKNTVYTNNNKITSTLGRFVYTQLKGGRSADCIQTTKAGQCFVNTENKADVEPDLIPENIQKGLVIFGVRGTLEGAEISYGSGAHRSPSSTSSPNRMDYKKNLTGESNILEAGTNQPSSALYPTDYSPVPKVSLHSEADVLGVNRSTWSNTTCGTSGTINQRIANCASTFSANATWKGTVKGNSGQSDWILVTRNQDSNNSNKNYEVWRDTGSGLLWSSLVSVSLNWCKASGSNGKQISTQTGTEFDSSTSAEKDPFSYCNSASYQNQTTPLSACYMDSGDGNGNYSFDTSFNQATTPGKAGLLSSLAVSEGKVFWRLPSIFDYMLANHHGLRFVLPDVGVSADEEWTATTSANNRKNAWTFSGKTGTRQVKQRNYPAAVRCVGR